VLPFLWKAGETEGSGADEGQEDERDCHCGETWKAMKHNKESAKEVFLLTFHVLKENR